MLLARFWKNRRGGVAPMLALSAIPLMGAVGAAVDYSRANAARAAFQASLDSTALTLSKTAATTAPADLQSSATNIFNAIFKRNDTSNVAITAVYTSNNGSLINISGSANVNTSFMSILGYPQITIRAQSKVKWGNSRLRVALVLDNTGSMAQDGKMDALKTASKNLLTQLKNAAVTDGDVYVSIIPFSKDVNADPTNYQADWVRWDLWEAANGTCSNQNYTTQSSCLSHNKIWTPDAHSTWNGCVTDRDQNYDVNNTAPTTSSTDFPAEQYGSCPVALMPLSYDWTALSSKIDAMTPNGNTNQAIGLQWGWQSLTASPFTIPAQDSNYTYSTVIILLTDGLNTQDRWYSSQSSIDARQEKICTNIKTAGITLYTVQVNTGGDPTSTLLQNCASDSSKFFLLTQANQIVTTFAQIGTALSNLRVAQ
jgi:Flp pilus assembly protein TadG